MTILDRYIGRTVILNILLALAVLLTLIGFITLLDEVEEVGRGDYGAADAFLYVLLVLPRYAYDVFPVAVLLGSLIGLGGLASHSELIAMRAAGISLGRIVLSVLKAGLLAMLAVVFVGEVVAPESEQYAEHMRSQKIYQKITLQTRYGFWARDGNAYVNIRTILPDSRLQDIYIYEFSDQRELKLATHAAMARYEAGQWLLEDVRQSYFKDGGVTSRRLDKAAWSSIINPELLDVVVTRPSILPVWGLYQYIVFLQENGQDARLYEVAFWNKIVTPLITLVMVFMSVPFVFGVLRSVGIGQRVFVGTMLGMGFLLLNQVLGNMALVYGLNPLFAAVFPGLLFLVIAFLFVRRIH